MKKSALVGAASLSLISNLVLAQNSPTAAPQPSYTIKIIDTSHEPNSFGSQTVTGLDDAGEVIGFYSESNGFIPVDERGFIYNTSDGTITLIPIPISGGSTLIPDAISNQGVITGIYGFEGRLGFVGGPLEFVYQNGTFTTFVVSLFSVIPTSGPTVKDVNDKGAVVGSTIRLVGSKLEVDGFLYSNGVVSYISVPGGDETFLVAINDQGVMSGNYFATDASGGGHGHGFIDNSGRFTTIDVPGATDTNIVAMNKQAEVVGTYVTTPGGATHGFVQHGNGKPTTLDIADAISTNPVAINNLGVVVGNYSTTNQNHGFVYDGHSTITTIEVPGATDIRLVGINNNGEIAGNLSLFDITTGRFLSRSFVAVPVGHTATANP